MALVQLDKQPENLCISRHNGTIPGSIARVDPEEGVSFPSFRGRHSLIAVIVNNAKRCYLIDS